MKLKYSTLLQCLGVSALTLTMAACSNNAAVATPPPVAAFSGSFVFSAAGTDPTDGDYFVIGSFVADGKGNITSGVADYNLGSGIDANVPLTGTYTVSGSTATIKLTDSKSVNDTFTTTLITSGTAPVTGFDGTGSGTLYPQVTSGFTPAGIYSYSVKGEGDGTVTGSGSFTASAAGTFTAGATTYTDTATTVTTTTATGFVYTPASSGRGQAALQGNNLAYYVIGPKQMLMINLDPGALLMFPVTKS